MGLQRSCAAFGWTTFLFALRLKDSALTLFITHDRAQYGESEGLIRVEFQSGWQIILNDLQSKTESPINL